MDETPDMIIRDKLPECTKQYKEAPWTNKRGDFVCFFFFEILSPLSGTTTEGTLIFFFWKKNKDSPYYRRVALPISYEHKLDRNEMSQPTKDNVLRTREVRISIQRCHLVV